ncbi:hypothetical protein C7475_107322 [Chitinophaga sp. S165]|nr:hypothetical protein C7475_107322 [Chitinophaga sp. S165]
MLLSGRDNSCWTISRNYRKRHKITTPSAHFHSRSSGFNKTGTIQLIFAEILHYNDIGQCQDVNDVGYRIIDNRPVCVRYKQGKR